MTGVLDKGYSSCHGGLFTWHLVSYETVSQLQPQEVAQEGFRKIDFTWTHRSQRREALQVSQGHMGKGVGQKAKDKGRARPRMLLGFQEAELGGEG